LIRLQDVIEATERHSRSEGDRRIRKDGIAIAQQVARELVKWECLPQLLSRPLRGGMGGHVEVDNATPVMGQQQKYVKGLGNTGSAR
jgi:hypothetical protein